MDTPSIPRSDLTALLIQLALLTSAARQKADQHAQQDAQRAAYYYGVAFAYEDTAERVREMLEDKP